MRGNMYNHSRKHAAKKTSISRTAVLVCVIAAIAAVAAAAIIIIAGNKPKSVDFEGSWISYYKGLTVTYSYDNGTAVFSDSAGNESTNTYNVNGNSVIFTGEEKVRVYEWSPVAVNFLADHQYGEIRQIVSQRAQEVENFNGYMYTDGDFLYVGMLCMCNSEKLSGYDNPTLGGEWLGASGDIIEFKANGGYSYREFGTNYDGEYSIDSDTGALVTVVEDKSATVEADEWGINGRVLNIKDQYYFRK